MLKSLKRRALRCSFCGKGADDVQKLIAGPNVYICDACVGSCNNIIAALPVSFAGWNAMSGPVAGSVGIEGGVVSGVINLESPGVRAPSRRPRHENRYHDA